MKSEWITLTSRCNNRCLFCYEHSPEGDSPPPRDEDPAVVRAQLQRARDAGATGVVLTGGEPTLFKQLGGAVAEARALGFEEILLATNGRRLAYAPYAERLVRAGLNHAHVSLYSHDAQVHDGLTLAPGSFDQTVQGIRALVGLGVKLTSNFIVNRRNCRDLVAFLDLMRELGVGRVSVMGLKPFGGAFKHREAVGFRPEEVAEPVSAALAYGLAAGLDLKTMGLSREHFDLRGTESDDRRALQYFEETVARMEGTPYCAGMCDACFGRPVCAAGAPGLPLGRLVCKCGYVYEATVRAAVRQGARTVETIGERTDACRRCRTCRPRIEAILAEERGRSAPILRPGPLPAPPRPAPPGAFAALVDVPAACRGEADTPGCAFGRGYLVYPELPCGQRCLFSGADPGSAEWLRRVLTLPSRRGGAVYVYGADGETALVLRRAAAGAGTVTARGDLLGSVLVAPAGATDPADVLPPGARRNARVGERAGLRFAVATDEPAIDALYSLYLAQCERLATPPLPRSFITAERDRAPEAFGVAVAWAAGGAPAAARLFLRQGNYLRIVDGGWRRDLAAIKPEAFLGAALVSYGLTRGVRVFDFGIAEASNGGLRTFKRGMGFREVGAVVGLAPATRVEAVPRRVEAGAPPPPPERGQAPPADAALLPGRIDVALGKRCNHRCLFCYRDAITREATTEEVKRKIATAAQSRHSGIALSGGEPTLRADLVELVACAREEGIRDIQLHTNGTKIADPRYLRRLMEAGLTSAMVSFHSHRPEVYRAITGSAHFEKARQALKNLLASGAHTLVSHVVCAFNAPDLPELPDYVAREFPGAEIFFFFVYPGEHAAAHPEIVPRLPHVEPSWYRALERLEELGVRYTVDCLAGFPPCYMRGHEHAAKILWMESLRDEIGDEADDHVIKLSEMRKPARCAACAYTDRCLGFWSSYLDRFGDEDLRPVPPEAAVASRRRRDG
ncbi:MAG: GNAT family N-acetyltransferase [Deltaproteobacteria bacterium]|nr:GNAT family N-acetyltransferase [Deltaproteobacteria bacterium]